jgi:hypothetical protein
MAADRLRRAPDSLFRIVGNDLYLTGPDRPSFDVLTGSATAIWRNLEDAPTLEELVGALASSHGTRPRAIEAEVGRFVDDLRDRGWVVVAP